MKGKIIKGIAGFYYVHVNGKGIYECKAKGIFRNRKIKPLVGDDVFLDSLDENGMKGNRDSSPEKCTDPTGIGECGSGDDHFCSGTAGPESGAAGPLFAHDGEAGAADHYLL